MSIQITEYRSYGRGADAANLEVANTQTLAQGDMSTPFGPGVDVIGVSTTDVQPSFVSLGQSPAASSNGMPVCSPDGVTPGVLMLDVVPGWRITC